MEVFKACWLTLLHLFCTWTIVPRAHLHESRMYDVGSVPGTSLVAVTIHSSIISLNLREGEPVVHGEENYILPCLCSNQLYRLSLKCPDNSTEHEVRHAVTILP